MDHKGLTAEIPGFVSRGHALGNRGRFVSIAPFLHLCLPVDICAAQLGRRGVVEVEIVGNAEGVNPIGYLVEADHRLVRRRRRASPRHRATHERRAVRES